MTSTSSAPSALKVSDYLSYLQVVMVNTTLPANIGSAARAMHTMGLSHLTVVDPKLPIDETSVSHAAGGNEILAAAKIAPTLEEAIGDCQLVFAASSRSRHLPRPVVTPTQAAKIMLDFIDMQADISDQSELSAAIRPKIAILFGREDRGLTNDELAFADYHIQIDANPDYPVLNVASAVQVIASFIFAYAQTHKAGANHELIDESKTNFSSHDEDQATSPLVNTYIRQQWDEPAITQQQLQNLTQRSTELMVALNLANSEHLRSLPARLSRLGSRLQLDQKEYQLLSALIAKLSKDC
ncbi:TrmJ/YjtD family RNA methyltransferase [uncultured Psychrobacter sp.]|uniref:RNA methyltransferase n=1 Tax=uncultured Psychrobacter sp. TaxID=259303 RepID=UPI002601BC09|nr:TrmJ/YjtD family RNA methyltransferase [uncultured Psychrobacter sp.]